MTDPYLNDGLIFFPPGTLTELIRRERAKERKACEEELAYWKAKAEEWHTLEDAERYRYLRNRNSAQVLETVGPEAGCWIDCDDKDGGLCLLTGEDADAAIDAAIRARKE